MKTIFQKIIDGELPCDKVFENEQIIAFKDIDPKAPIHILIVPKKAVPNMQCMKDDDLHLFSEMAKAAQEIARRHNIEDGYRLIINNGAKAGQTVFHLHAHMIGGTTLHDF
ncbi:MAG: histidine triad nucleotide-binding protein [Simkaniaceae bacterium]|nr:histidine triad nucleotide-binding protein [Simkaniaceae bacterium]